MQTLIDAWPHVRDLALVYGLSFFIGWDRELSDRSAGLRTFPLVAVAACGFWQAMEGLVSESEGRGAVAQGIITRIGVIGRGAILQCSESVRGTATAASLWATGAIGLAVGAGAYDVAVVIAVAPIGTLRIVGALKPGRRVCHSSAATTDDPKPPDEQSHKRLPSVAPKISRWKGEIRS